MDLGYFGSEARNLVLEKLDHETRMLRNQIKKI